MNKVFIFGPRYSGKTVLLSVMADQLWLQRFEKKIFLGYSTQLAKLAFLSPSYGKFPEHTKTGTYEEFDFNVCYRHASGKPYEISDLRFLISDYSGNDVFGGGSIMLSKLESEIDNADMVIIIVDGFSLLNYFVVKSENIDFGALNLGDSRFSKVKFDNIIMRCKASNKKYCIAISKSDYVNTFIDINEVIKKMREKFNTISSLDIAIIPISSTGSGVTEDKIVRLEKRVGENCMKIDHLVSKVNSSLKPENIDVLFMFILSNLIKKHISIDYLNNIFISDLYRIMEPLDYDFTIKYPESVSLFGFLE